MQAVIQAGGRGTRLNSVTNDEIPKPMVLIGGKPLLQRQIETLRMCGIDEFIILLGHLGGVIRSYFGDGSTQGIAIRYIQEPVPLGSGGALFFLQELIQDESFLLVFGDILFDIDVERMREFHDAHGALATLLVHPNAHPYDSDLVMLDEKMRITGFDSKYNPRDFWYKNLVNAGICMVNAQLCKNIPPMHKLNFEQDIILPYIQAGTAIYGYQSPEYVKDIGTPDRLEIAEQDLRQGIVAARNLKKKQRCIFLDRDGTINHKNGFIDAPEQLELLPGVAEAIGQLNRTGWLACVVTNQPVVARGLCSIAALEVIHAKLTTLLGQEGAYVDGIAHCPHHPDKGYPGEDPRYKVPCHCRKPGTGMIDLFVERYNIDPARSWMVGDTTVDIETGRRAGLATALVLTGDAGKDGKYAAAPILIGNNLAEVVEQILSA